MSTWATQTCRDAFSDSKVGNKEKKVFIGHGNADRVVKPSSGREVSMMLQKCDVSFKEYDDINARNGHGPSKQMLDDMCEFIKNILG